MSVPTARADTSLLRLSGRTHSLMPVLTSTRTLKVAARRCMRRCAAPGPDRVTWRQYRVGLQSKLDALSASLRADSWRHGSVRTLRVTHFSGATSVIAVPNVEDRIVHRALRNTMEPLLEAFAFPDFVSGFRPRRNRITAVRLSAAYLESNPWVADVDVAKITAFERTDFVMDLLARFVSDGSFLLRVRRVLEAFDRPLQPGSGLTPLLMNLLLLPVDEAVTDSNVVRFGDNYCIFCPSETEACESIIRLATALERIGLSINRRKSSVRSKPNAEDLFLLGE